MAEGTDTAEIAIAHRGNIDPSELATIRAFVWSTAITTPCERLRIEAKNGSTRLLTRKGKLLAVKKQLGPAQDKILIGKKSAYNHIIAQVLVGDRFVAIEQNLYPDFDEYHHYRLPENYQLKHTDVLQLWKLWWNKKRRQFSNPDSNLDILIFASNNWYEIQDFRPKQGNFAIATAAAEVIVTAEAKVIWASKTDPIQTPVAPPQAEFIPTPPPPPKQTESGIPTDIMSQIDPPQPTVSNTVTVTLSNEGDLESYLKTFNTEDTEDVETIENIYQIDRLVNVDTLATVEPTQSMPSVNTTLPSGGSTILQDSVAIATNSKITMPDTERDRLKQKAIEVLSDYLQSGETIEITEVIKNGEGRVISERRYTTHKECSQWQIDRVLKLVEE
jgi:hypothetical protein